MALALSRSGLVQRMLKHGANTVSKDNPPRRHAIAVKFGLSCPRHQAFPPFTKLVTRVQNRGSSHCSVTKHALFNDSTGGVTAVTSTRSRLAVVIGKPPGQNPEPKSGTVYAGSQRQLFGAAVPRGTLSGHQPGGRRGILRGPAPHAFFRPLHFWALAATQTPRRPGKANRAEYDGF